MKIFGKKEVPILKEMMKNSDKFYRHGTIYDGKNYEKGMNKFVPTKVDNESFFDLDLLIKSLNECESQDMKCIYVNLVTNSFVEKPTENEDQEMDDAQDLN